MSFLTDSGWMAVLVGTITLILTLFVSYKARKKKSLSYEILSDNPLISIGDEVKGKLQLLFDGHPVQNLHLLLVRFINNGNLPILASDYERPLTLKFAGASNILSAEYVSSSPNTLVTSATIGDHAVSIDPVLMNGGDYFTIKILVAEYFGPFQVDTRIIGVKEVRANRKQARGYTSWILPAFIGLTITLIAWSIPFKYLVDARVSYPPIIKDFKVSQYEVPINGTIDVNASALSPSGDKLNYLWSVSGGEIETNGPSAHFKAPASPGIYNLRLIVMDKFGRTASEQVSISVVPAQGNPEQQKNNP